MIARSTAARKAGKVLVVNYDYEISRILEVNLAHANLEVVLAESGAEALEIIRRDKADIIIVDQELLDMESSDIFRHIKELSGDIPVILIGSPSQKIYTPAKAYEIAVSYIAKPFDPQEVVALVQGHLMHKERTMNINPPAGLPERARVSKETAAKKWRSGLPDVDSIQTAMEISRKEAREALKSVQLIVASLVETVPPALKDSFDRLAGDVQELAVLCNRSLYLVHTFNSRLEMQQERLLQQESEQRATSEAVLTICRHITRSMKVERIFDLKSSKRVVKYTLAIAKELGISDVEQRTLYHAALIKDIALAFSPLDIIERTALIGHEIAVAVKERLNLMWKALAAIPFLVPACNLLLYRYERYNGTGGTFGLKGTDIPLGSRILAVADAFDSLAYTRSLEEEIASRLAVPQITAESGSSFDPQVVNALSKLWKRNELEFVFTENKGEIGLGNAQE